MVYISKNLEAKFNLYFLAYLGTNPAIKERSQNLVAKWEGLLELMWNYGTKNQEGPVYQIEIMNLKVLDTYISLS